MAALTMTLEDSSEPVREASTWALSHLSGPGLSREKLTDVPPKPLVQTRPEYPAEAYSKRIAGRVVLTILISSIGKVVHAEVRESIPGLDEAALACVRDWQFEPARRGGKSVACVASVPVTFRIY
jgi:TonB family protein